MTNTSDWRLTNQENFLKGVTLVRRSYRPPANNPRWDHDHCAFCWATFSLKDIEGASHEGYATLDDYYWICPKCFEDFKDLFQWNVINSSEQENNG